jgi:hypothetical protein
MGKSTTPTYRVEIWDNANNKIVPMKSTWDYKYFGKPTNKKLEKYIVDYIESLKFGGVNYHISELCGFIPVPNKARIVNQFTNDVVSTWIAPMFMVI